MDPISASAASGMRARMESLEMLANNLANVETGGFKADREFFSIFTGDDATADPQTGDVLTLPVVESHWTDFAQGNLIATANPLDLAIDGDGLFTVQTPHGVRYTRNGNFRIGATGLLTTSDGNPLGAQGGGSITIDPTMPVEVLPDGTLQQGGQAVAQLELVSFDRAGMNKFGTNYFVAPDSAKPKPASGTVVQGKLEQSNVGAAEASVRLVAIMRQFEMLQKAMNIGNDLNRQAIEQVARVSS